MEFKLEDIADVTMGQSPKSEFYNNEGEGLPFLQGNRTFGRRFPTFDTFTTNITKRASAGDVIMSVRAPVGDLNITPVDMCLGRGVCGIRMKNGKQDFLFYLMKHNMQQLLNKEAGTVFGSVNRNDINGLVVDIPDEETQDKIASFLGQIDRKIENNEAINRNLNDQVKTVFSKMFPSISTDGGNKLVEIIEFTNGKKRPDSEGVIPVYGGNGILSCTDKTNAENCVIVGRVGAYCGSLYLSVAPCWISDNAIKAKAKDSSSQLFIFYLLQVLGLPNRHIGTSQPLLTQGILNAIPFTKPDLDKVVEFCDYADLIRKQIDLNNKAISELAELRDSLLPKLMSGKLDVSDLEI